jgi:glycosyltransferase 2 family protein
LIGEKVQGRSRLRRVQPWLLRGIGLLLLVYLLAKIQPGEILTYWAGTKKSYLLLGVGLAYGMMLVKIERWRLLLKAQRIMLPFMQAVSAYFSSYYIGIATPGRAGEFLKVLQLRQKTGASIGAGLVSAAADRLLDVLMLVGLAALGILLIPQFNLMGGALLWSLVMLAGLLVVIRLARSDKILQMGRWVGQKAGKELGKGDHSRQVQDFVGGWKQISSPEALLQAGILTLVSWLLLLGACYLILLSLSIEMPFWFLAFATAIAGLLSLLPVSVAGIGVRDSALAAVFGLVGISVQASLAYSLLYFAVFGIALGITGAVFWYRDPLIVD